MSWLALQSGHMNGMDYDETTGMLTIQFINGAVYRSSSAVPQTIADTLMQVSSPGAYYHDKIKDDYGMVKIMDGATKSGRRSRKRY